MRVVIPAAGQGTRLRPLTDDRPKALVDVAGKPLLARVFDAVYSLDVSGFVVVVGYRGEAIVERFGDAYRGLPIHYVHQETRRGLGDAVLCAEGAVDGPFLVVNGDNAIDADLSPVLAHHREHGPTATLPLWTVPAAEARETGVAVVEDGRVTAVVEKPEEPASTTVMTGIGVYEPALFDACRRVDPSVRGEVELPDAIDLLVREGHRVDALAFPGWRLNVNTPSDVEAAARRFGAVE